MGWLAISSVHVSLLEGCWVRVAVDDTIDLVGVSSDLVRGPQVLLTVLMGSTAPHVLSHASTVVGRRNHVLIRTAEEVDIAPAAWRVVHLDRSVSSYLPHVMLGCLHLLLGASSVV